MKKILCDVITLCDLQPVNALIISAYAAPRAKWCMHQILTETHSSSFLEQTTTHYTLLPGVSHKINLLTQDCREAAGKSALLKNVLFSQSFRFHVMGSYFHVS